MSELREQLASLAHHQWAGWMRYLFSKCEQQGNGSVIIPSELVARWQRQMRTAYADLPEEEKDSDRKEADRVLHLCTCWITGNPGKEILDR